MRVFSGSAGRGFILAVIGPPVPTACDRPRRGPCGATPSTVHGLSVQRLDQAPAVLLSASGWFLLILHPNLLLVPNDHVLRGQALVAAVAS